MRGHRRDAPGQGAPKVKVPSIESSGTHATTAIARAVLLAAHLVIELAATAIVGAAVLEQGGGAGRCTALRAT